MGDLFLYANYYYNFGFNITCILNETNVFNKNSGNGLLKAPGVSWKQFNKERQSLEVLHSYDWENAKGLGVVLGYNNLRAIDVDGCDDLSIIEDFTYTLFVKKRGYPWVIKSGSHRGFHILFYAEDHDYQFIEDRVRNRAFRPTGQYSNKFKHLELRWNGHLVLPPSIHSSLNHYEFYSGKIPVNPPGRLLNDLLNRLIIKYCDPLSQVDHSKESSRQPEKELQKEAVEELRKTSDGAWLYIGRSYAKPLFMVFDTETTGLPIDPSASERDKDNWPRIVQIAWQLIDSNGVVIISENHYIKPNYPPTYSTSENIHGINRHLLESQGKDFRIVFERFAYTKSNADFLVAHNYNFDQKIINSEFFRRKYSSQMIGNKEKHICTMVASKDYCQIESSYGYKWPKLSELYYILFGKELVAQHNAINDVRATAECFFELRQLGIIKFNDL